MSTDFKKQFHKIKDRHTRLEIIKCLRKLEITPELELQRKLSEEKTRATVFEGLKSIKNFYNNIIEELRPGDEYLVLGATYGKDIYSLKSFFQNYHTRRK